MIYDCLNKFTVDFEFDGYETSEKELMKRNMKKYKRFRLFKR